jgi:hypothetical protein
MNKPHHDHDHDDLFAAALDVVRRALDEDGGTALAVAPAARASFEVVDADHGRATVVVAHGEVYFLRTRHASSALHRTGWFKMPLPSQHVGRR